MLLFPVNRCPGGFIPPDPHVWNENVWNILTFFCQNAGTENELLCALPSTVAANTLGVGAL